MTYLRLLSEASTLGMSNAKAAFYPGSRQWEVMSNNVVVDRPDLSVRFEGTCELAGLDDMKKLERSFNKFAPVRESVAVARHH